MGQHGGFLQLDSPWDGAFLPQFPFCQEETKNRSAEKLVSPQSKFLPVADTISIPVSPFQSKTNTEQMSGSKEPPPPIQWVFHAVSRRHQEVKSQTQMRIWGSPGTDKGKHSPIPWPDTLGKHLPNSALEGRQVSVGGAKSSGDPLVQALIWAMANL